MTITPASPNKLVSGDGLDKGVNMVEEVGLGAGL